MTPKPSDSQPTVPPWHGRPTIFAHISKHLEPQTGRLNPDGYKLPDEEVLFSPEELRWVAGGLDGAIGHHAGAGRDSDIAQQVADLLIAISQSAPLETKIQLYTFLESDNILNFVDPTIEQAIEGGLQNSRELHDFAKFLAQDTPDRGAVKFGIALLGILRHPEDVEMVFTLGKHEEFTLYAAVALTNMLEDPEAKLYALAKCVDGWGRIHLVERLDQTQSPEIKEWLLRQGYKNSIMYAYTAFTCTMTGDLLGAINVPSIDPELFVAASELIESLLMEGGPGEDIRSYPYAAALITAYLHHVGEHPLDLPVFPVLNLIERYLKDDDWDSSAMADSDWDEMTRQRCLKMAEDYLDQPEWIELTQHYLHSRDETEFYLGDRAARILNLNTWDLHWQRLRENPTVPGNWFRVMQRVNIEQIDAVLAFAMQSLPLEEIGSGPAAKSGIGKEFQPHSCLDFVLQDLVRFPGKGEALALAGLSSPVIRNRNLALKVLASWPSERRNPTIEVALQSALEIEPKEDVRERIQRVRNGEPLV